MGSGVIAQVDGAIVGAWTGNASSKSYNDWLTENKFSKGLLVT